MKPGVRCPECGSGMYVRETKRGSYWACKQYAITGCTGKRGMNLSIWDKIYGEHAETFFRLTKDWRILAHQYFDVYTKGIGLSRDSAYKFLALSMNLELQNCHIGYMGIPRLRRAIKTIIDSIGDDFHEHDRKRLERDTIKAYRAFRRSRGRVESFKRGT